MNNVFSAVKIYDKSWNVIEDRKFNEEELACITSCEIVNGDYGLSACFSMVGGGCCYFQLSKESTLMLGDTPDVRNLRYLRLERDGEECERVL